MVSREHFWRKLGQVMGGAVSIVRCVVIWFGAGGISDRFLPEVLGGFRVDVSENEDEIVVVADLPGAEPEDTTICLLSPTNLWITSTRRSGQSDLGEEGRAVRRERASGRMHRVVALPHAATAENGRASFDNGVLEIRLKTAEPERGEQITIEEPFSSPSVHRPRIPSPDALPRRTAR